MKGRKAKISRRGFLKGTAAGVAAFTIVPRHVLGGAGNVAPSDTFGGALIGCGGRGPGTFSDLKGRPSVGRIGHRRAREAGSPR